MKLNSNMKKGLITLLSGAGVIALLLGIFTRVYDFGVGLVLAVTFWILTAAVTKMLGLDRQYRKKENQ